MNTILSRRISMAVFIAVSLALFAAACAPVPTAQAAALLLLNPAAAIPSTGSQSDPATAPEAALVIHSLTVQSTARVFTMAPVYQQPDAYSEVIRLITPGNSVTVLGLNGDGTYFAINTGAAAGQVTGWIAAADLSYEKILTQASSLARIYSKPDSGNTTGILVPDQPVSLLGTSPNGDWSAVATNIYAPQFSGWVRTEELNLSRPSGEMLNLTKTHLVADEDSRVYDILTPTQMVALLGRTQDGSWIAVASPDGSTFRGWVKASEVKITSGEQILPVLPTD